MYNEGKENTMALTTLCDNCEHDWLVDQLVFVDVVNQNLCPVCINHLIDLLVGGCSFSQWGEYKKQLEEDM